MTGLAFVTQPSNTNVRTAISPAVRVAQVNACGDIVIAAAPKTVSISLGVNPRQAVLSGQSAASTVSGVATFSGLALDNEGVGMTLVATATGLPATTSTPFTTTDNIAPAAPTLAISAALTQQTSMTLNWDAAGDDGNLGSNVSGRYQLCRGLMPLQDSVCLDSATGGLDTPGPVGFPEEATFTGLAPNTLYYFRLRVFDAAGNTISSFAQGRTLQ